MTSINPQNTAAVQASAPPPPYGSMNQVNSGPAALLYTLANEIIKIDNELQQLYNEMTVAETNVQEKTITAGADAQRAASQNNALSIVFEAVGACAGAAITLSTTIAEAKSVVENNNALNPQQTELDRLNELDKLTSPKTNLVVGDAARPPVDSGVTARASSLRTNPAYPSEEDTELFKRNPEQWKVKNQEAIDAMRAGEYESYKSNLQERISAKEKAVNTIQSRISHTQQSLQQYSSIGSQLINAGTNGGKAYFANKSGQEEAVRQVTDGVTRLASGTADTTRQGIGQYGARVSEVISNARAGAQAYAQT